MSDWFFRFCRWRIRRLLRRVDWWEWLIGERRPRRADAEDMFDPYGND